MAVRVWNVFLSFFLLSIFFGIAASASPSTMTFQARIIKPDGQSLENNSVYFRFRYTDSVGTCVLYEEEYTAVNMTNSKGLVVLTMGGGTKTYPPGGVTLYDILNYGTSLNCKAGGAVTPAASDRRQVVVEFDDASGAGLQSLPGMNLNSVPYALHARLAVNANQLGGVAASDYARLSDMTAAGCVAGQALRYNGTSFVCEDVNAGSLILSNNLSDLPNKGTARSNLGLGSAATLNTGVASGDIAILGSGGKLSASVLPGSVVVSGSGAGGDLTGTYPNPAVATVGSKTASELANTVDEIAAATANATANTLVKRNASGDASFAKINIGNVSVKNFTGGSAYTLTLPSTAGSSGYVLSTNGSGDLSWVAASSGSVTGVTASSPLSSSGGVTPNISIIKADAATNGYLSSADWSLFNNKMNNVSSDVTAALGFTPVNRGGDTMTGALVLPSSGLRVGNNALMVSGDSVGIGTASPSTALHVSGDVTIANNGSIKTASGDINIDAWSGKVRFGANGPSTFTGGYGLASNQQIHWTQFVNNSYSGTPDVALNRNAAGVLEVNNGTSGNLATFLANNLKASTDLTLGNVILKTTSGGGAYTLSLPADDGTPGQVLSTNGSGDLSWIAASSGSVTGVTASSPLASSGGATPNITMTKADAATNGYLSSADWSVFSAKLSNVSSDVTGALGYTPLNSAGGTINGVLDVSSSSGTDQIKSSYNVNKYTTLTTNSSGNSILRGFNNGGTNSITMNNAAGASADITFNSGGTDVMTMTGTGRVGIGTTSPSTALHVSGDTTLSGVTTLGGRQMIRGTSDYDGAMVIPSGGYGITLFGYALGINSWGQYDVAIGTGTGGSANAGVTMRDGVGLQWTSNSTSANNTPDVILMRDGANKLGMRNGTNAQTFNIYNTYTNASNNERLGIGFVSNVITFNSSADGTGTVRNFNFANGKVGIGNSSPGSTLSVSGDLSIGNVILKNTTGGGAYTLSLPVDDGTSGQVLSTNGSGDLSWISPSTGSVTNVTASAPLSSSGGATPNISITRATAAVDGYLSSSDWSLFNSKMNNVSSDVTTALGYTPLSNALSSGLIFVGNAGNVATAVAMSGDATISNTGIVSLKNSATARGNLGLGTTAVLNTGSAAGDIPLLGTGGIVANQMCVANSSGTGIICNSTIPTSSQWTTNGSSDISFANKVGIGTTAPTVPLHISASAGSILIDSFANSSQIVGRRAQGTQGSPTALGFAGYNLFELMSSGYTSAGSYASHKAISILTAQGWTGSAQGNEIRFYTTTNGASSDTERMIIANSGNIGIGTSSPGAQLHIQNTGTEAVPAIFRVNGTDTTNGEAKAVISQSSTGSDLLLLVAGADTRTDGRTANDSYIEGQQRLNLMSRGNSVSGNVSNVGIKLGVSGNYAYGDITFLTNGVESAGVERMRITSSGDVSIGVGSSPGASLDISGNIKIRGGSPGAGKVLTSDSTGLASWQSIGSFSSSDITSALGYTPLNVAGGNMTGSLGIGVNNPNGTLTLGSGSLVIRNVSGDATGLELSQASSDTSKIFNFYSGPMTFGTANTERVRIDASGKVGIGTTNPTRKFYVSGDSTTSENTGVIYVRHSFTGSHGAALSISRNGDDATASLALGTDSSNNGLIGANASELKFGKFQSGSFYEYLRFDTNGNAGFGNITPGASLDISGNIKIRGGSPGTGKVLTSDSTGLATWTSLGSFASTDITSALGYTPLNKAGGTMTGSLTMGSGGNIALDNYANIGFSNTGGTNGAQIFLDNAVGSYAGANGLAFYVNGGGRMAITSNGYVGIGTNNPESLFHMDHGGNSAKYAVFGGNGGYERLIIGTNQNGTPFIGKGVKKTGDDNNIIAETNDNTPVDHLVMDFGNNGINFRGASHISDDLTISLNTLLYIGSDGNVGIGTTNASKKLSVAGGIKVGDNAAYKDLYLQNTTAVGSYNGTFEVVPATAPGSGVATHATYFRSNGTSSPMTRHDVLVDGNVGIGTTSPGAALHLYTANGNVEEHLESYSNGPGNWSGFRIKRARGTASSPALTVDGDNLFTIHPQTWNGSAFANSGQISAAQDGTYSSGSAAPIKWTFGTTGSGSAMTIKNSGNIGIGTASPNYTEEISGTLGFTTGASWRKAITPTYWGYSSNYKVLMLGSTSTTYNVDDGAVTLSLNYNPSGNPNSAFSGDGRELLVRNGTQFVTPGSSDTTFNLYNLVLKDGNVGIGTANPTKKLTVGSNLHSANDGILLDGILSLAWGTGITAPSAGNMVVYHESASGGSLRVKTSSTDALTVQTNGYVGVGTTSPSTLFHVKSSSPDLRIEGTSGAATLSFVDEAGASRGLLYISDTGADQDALILHASNDDIKFRTKGGAANDTSTSMTIEGDGDVGIGTVSPDERFVVYNGSTTGKYTTSGWTHSSDARLKHDITPLEDSLNKVLQLKGVNYKFNSDPEKRNQVGFIAQDVEKVFPEVVLTDKNGFKSMVYANLVAPVVEAVKELYAKITGVEEINKQQSRDIASLKEKNEKLEKENAEFKKRLEALEKSLKK